MTVRLNGTARVTLALRVSGGRTLLTVRRTLPRGAHGVSLVVPGKARHLRRLTFRLMWAGHVKNFTVKLEPELAALLFVACSATIRGERGVDGVGCGTDRPLPSRIWGRDTTQPI